MESVNEIFEKAIEFLSIIQTICNERRLQVEQFCVKHHAIYFKDRKEELKKEEEKARRKAKEEEKAALSVIECLEELSAGDSLLRKARLNRSKSKVSPELLAELTRTSSEYIVYDDKHTASTMKEKVDAENCSKNQSALPRCNSAPNSVAAKLSRGLQSRSVHSFNPKRDNCLTSAVSSTRKCPIAQTSNGQKSKTAFNSNVGYISSKNYKDLKELAIKSSLSKHKEKDKKCIKDKVDTSDSPQNLHPPPPLTYQTFKQDLTKRCCLESNFQMPSSGFWYSFVSFKNRECLVSWSKCNSVEKFTSVVNLIFEIQEIMMWIDILTFLGDEIFPSLRLIQKNDENYVRLYSHLSSIYHEGLQRTPMLDFDS